ncbi:MAG TPA: Gfo/Idh/MocA family oxidoreductase [Pelobium sp.]
MKTVNIGIIGGGLMGKEAASAIARWFVFNNVTVQPKLVAIADLNANILDWYRQIPTVKLLTTNYKEILAMADVDVIYAALPHQLHLSIYQDIIASGKDLLAEKPFGINLQAANQIAALAAKANVFVRCSSEMPFLPGAQRLIKEIKESDFGDIIEVNAGFLHASDMDPQKKINWKRQNEFCGEIGVMGDLGMHVLHIPLRMGWMPASVYAQLQKIITKRPNEKGELVEADTWNNALLNTWVNKDGKEFPMKLEMKRLAPGETNTWYIEVLGTKAGFRYSTKDTKTFWEYKNADTQTWSRIDLGFDFAFPTITGKIFEAGFPDCFMQMIAAFLMEREGQLQQNLGCVTPQEAVSSHQLFAAALLSHKKNTVEKLAIQ